MATQLNQTKSSAYATGEMKAVDARPKPEGIVLRIITDTGHTIFTVALRPKLIIGRGDDQTPVDIDLTSFGGAEKGVSRKHVMLMQHGARVYVLDLGSKNGTHINGKVLRTGSIYELQENDELQLGKLKISVTFDYEPVTATALPNSPQNYHSPETIADVKRAE